ncbi:glycerol-3-phosphate acyltransferase [Lederbergia citrea]|uniref:glycerol-3-phosphate acyltransferase n=1 Tax=Lederbergia citrea TaxID=2833581 RepID=UPI001BCA0C14|nr:glycerol-3-phosphate acyltransferase [Lederbergia citrea]MBS4179222.1 glycerol-3-phosphate acyltransferase [Lederbergia citrea]
MLIGAYLLGNILTGYVLAKFFYNKDIHQEGSGNVGARNAGRLFGKKAFVITFLGDALKGACAVLFAKWLGLAFDWQLFILFTVIVGHVFPLVLHFKGGKGMSTYIGGMLTFQPLLFSAFAGVFIIFYFIFKSLTSAGMAAVAVLPIILIIFSFELPVIINACLLSAIVIFAHRHNIKEKIIERKIS